MCDSNTTHAKQAKMSKIALLLRPKLIYIVAPISSALAFIVGGSGW